MKLGRSLGLAVVAALFTATCSSAAMATVGLAAGSTAASDTGQRVRLVDRTELRPYAIRVRGTYYVRIGAFDERDAAQDLALELRRVTTEPVKVAEYGIGDGRDAVRLYRVLIGPASSRTEVVDLVDTLKGMGYGSMRATRSVAPETVPVPAPEIVSAQRPAAADLVEPVGDETGGTRAVTQRPQTPAPEREAAHATEGEVPSPGDPAEDLATWGDTDVARSPHEVSAGSELESAPPQVGAYAPERRVRAFLVSEDGRRFLQMAAYAAHSTAETLASQLRLVTSEPVFISEVVDDGGRSVYRVRIGPVESDDSLATLLDALRPKYETGWVLPATRSTSVARSTPLTPSTPPTKARTTTTAWVIYGDSERFVQVGAYSARSTANAIASELSRQIDGTVRVTEVSRDSGDPVYRVRIGPVLTDDSLKALVDALELLGYLVD